MDLVSRVRGRQSKCTAMCSQMSVGNKHFRQKEAQGGFRGCLVWSNNYHLHQYITLSLISFQNHSSCRECPKLCCNKLTKLGRCDRETIELANHSNDNIVRTAGRVSK